MSAALLSRLTTDFAISPTHGFLPSTPPLLRLSDTYYTAWEDEGALLPTSLKDGTLRQRIRALPILTTARLVGEEEWRRAYVILGFLTNAYLFATSPPERSLPACLAQPMIAVSDHLGTPCVPTYCGQTLWNYRWRPVAAAAAETPDESGGFSADRLQTLASFTGSSEESWFFSTSVAIEARGARLIPVLLEAMELARCGGAQELIVRLEEASRVLRQIEHIVADVPRSCSPQFFYHTLRPYLEGTAGLESVGMPQGIMYSSQDGVGGSFQKFRGPSNAQSSLFAFIDAALGVKHEHEPFLREMRAYMPRSHRLFLDEVDQLPSIGTSIGLRLQEVGVDRAYDDCLSALASFRRKHIEIVTRYVVNMSSKGRVSTTNRGGATNQPVSISGPQGTGGTRPVEFLKRVRDDVLRAKTELRDHV